MNCIKVYAQPRFRANGNKMPEVLPAIKSSPKNPITLGAVLKHAPLPSDTKTQTSATLDFKGLYPMDTSSREGLVRAVQLRGKSAEALRVVVHCHTRDSKLLLERDDACRPPFADELTLKELADILSQSATEPSKIDIELRCVDKQAVECTLAQLMADEESIAQKIE